MRTGPAWSARSTRWPRSRRSPRTPRARRAPPSSGGRESGSERTSPLSHRMRIVCSPTPSMSATPVQLISVSRPRDGHARFGQRCIASPSGFTISVPHNGQCVGIRNSFVPRRCGPAGPTICGITSPARCTITSSPARMPLRLMSSSLWSVARVTVTPPTWTGSMIAHGLSAPVRPTRMRISSSRVDGRHRRPLVRARPARTLVQTPSRALLVEGVDLDHDAVDLVVELQPALLPLDARGGDLVDRLEPLGVRIRAQAVLAQPLEHLELRLELDTLATARLRRPRSRAAGRR